MRKIKQVDVYSSAKSFRKFIASTNLLSGYLIIKKMRMTETKDENTARYTSQVIPKKYKSIPIKAFAITIKKGTEKIGPLRIILNAANNQHTIIFAGTYKMSQF